MKKNILATVVAAATISMAGVAVADDSYRMELGGMVGIMDLDAFDKKTKTVGVDFTYHFDEVSTVNVPRSEAAFIGKSSNVQAEIVHSELDKSKTNPKIEVNDYVLGVEGYIENIYLNVNFDYAQNKVNGAKTVNNKDYSARVGYMFIDGLRAHIGLANGDSYEDGKGKKKADVALGAKYVGDFDGTGQFFNLEGEVTAVGVKDNKGDRVTSFSLQADYFITHDASAGLRVAKSNANGDDEAFIGLGAQYFVMPNFNIELELGKQDKDKVVGLRLSGRF